jgi:hypothetical protein
VHDMLVQCGSTVFPMKPSPYSHPFLLWTYTDSPLDIQRSFLLWSLDSRNTSLRFFFTQPASSLLDTFERLTTWTVFDIYIFYYGMQVWRVFVREKF